MTKGEYFAAIQGRRSSKQSWITLLSTEPILRLPTLIRKTVRIRGPGFAKAISKHFAVRVARLQDGASAGVRWIASREVCSGYSQAKLQDPGPRKLMIIGSMNGRQSLIQSTAQKDDAKFASYKAA